MGRGAGDEGGRLSGEHDTGGTTTGEATPDGASSGQKPGRDGYPWVLAAVAGTIVIPSLLWAAILAVPFLPLTTGQKVWTVGGLAVAAETVFWISALLFGWEVARRYRRFLDPRGWLRKLREK